MARSRKGISLVRSIECSALILIAFFVLFPIAWFILTAFKLPIDVYTLKVFFKPTIENFYKVLFEPFHLLPLIKNSVIVSVITTATVIPLAALAAYSFSRFKIIASQHILFGIISTQFMPPIVMVLPFYVLFRGLGLLDTRTALIIIDVAMILPFAIWMLKGYFDGIPVEIEEAALVDGCSRLQSMRHVTLALCMPGIVVTGIFSLFLAWNEFLFALILTNKYAVTLPVGLVGLHTHDGIVWEGMAVAGILIMFPMFLLALFFQRHFVRGLTLGAIQ